MVQKQFWFYIFFSPFTLCSAFRKELEECQKKMDFFFHGVYSLLYKFSFEMPSGELLQGFFPLSFASI